MVDEEDNPYAFFCEEYEDEVDVTGNPQGRLMILPGNTLGWLDVSPR